MYEGLLLRSPPFRRATRKHEATVAPGVFIGRAILNGALLILPVTQKVHFCAARHSIKNVIRRLAYHDEVCETVLAWMRLKFSRRQYQIRDYVSGLTVLLESPDFFLRHAAAITPLKPYRDSRLRHLIRTAFAAGTPHRRLWLLLPAQAPRAQ